ncbi:MAG TPA: fructosamine kinase family protein [Fimbriimonas sp.]
MYGAVVREEPLTGGLMSTVSRLAFEDGRSLVYKESVNPPPELFECEADGLTTLSRIGGVRVPEIYEVGETFILLEDFGPQSPRPPAYWEEFGRVLARMHLQRSERFGYHRDNYIGSKRTDNGWAEDGASYFAETRILRFLGEPLVDAHLTAEDRSRIERFAASLPGRLPKQGPSLVHGDLWPGNMLATRDDGPALIDPAVYYGLPEADLALLPDFEQVPEAFYRAYLELHPLEPGWRDRLRMLGLRDALGMVAEFGDQYGSLERVRSILQEFA